LDSPARTDRQSAGSRPRGLDGTIWSSTARLPYHMLEGRPCSWVWWMNSKPTMMEWKLHGARSCTG